MFKGAKAFNSDLSAWSVAAVTDMEMTFMDATKFNGAIGSWDVSGVTSLQSTFTNAAEFNAASDPARFELPLPIS